MKLAAVLLLTAITTSHVVAQNISSWKTNWDKSSIDVQEIISGGVPRDGIPPVDNPQYVTVSEASEWVNDREPVILVKVGEDVRAFPLQVLTYHEIVNTVMDGIPVTVTFCPLCYSTIVFNRELDGTVYDFGVSGLLRHSDLIMYDRQTESLWQQVTGEAIVGDLTGAILEAVPSQLISFEQFATRYPNGLVLSRETGHTRNYGTNPYVGYDDIDDKPFLFSGEPDGRLRPMERVVTVTLGDVSRAYPYSVTRKKKVINDVLGESPIVVFHDRGAVSALDKSSIRKSKEIGTTGVFDRNFDGRILTFSFKNGVFVDDATGTEWDVTGHAVSGDLEGAVLKPITHGNYFSFAWFAFRPETEVYR